MYNNILNNSMTESELLSDDSNDGYDSDSEIKLEITEYNKNAQRTHTYAIPYKSSHSNRKKLLCFSVINNEYCDYGDYCTYAHNLNEQIIDIDNLYIYQIILDRNLMNFFSLSNPKTEYIYKKLLFYSYVCPKCISGKCMGGYNCKYGAHDTCLKLCKNDLLTGQCINKLININMNKSIFDKMVKIEPIEKAPEYTGCINGHHLSKRNLVPYYKYINQKEYSKKNMYQSVRRIDINNINNIYNLSKKNYISEYSSESTDEEISQWFNKNNHISSDESTDEFIDNEKK